MPTHKVKKAKPSTSENAEVSKGWNDAIQGRKAVWCEEAKALKYKKL